ncbi:sushi, von Willebrand factor type A, EGF and pentraxin domain-containing protein 1-like [Sycon ciliatum]|uniref:sushi, von Willebrand factor type A, EGF and pentraxin domain-containing protein 1-like n=1 Tax=Sycon ciliatum TaxID=27933 RepID=UPI0031F6EB2F
MTFQEQCETGAFPLINTVPSNTSVLSNRENRFYFNNAKQKCVATSRFKCNSGYGFTTDNGTTWAQRIKFESDGSDWIVQNDCIKITTYCSEPGSVLNGIQAGSDNNGRALGSTRTFRCKDGYNLKAGSDPVITCTKNKSRTGLWTQLPVCEEIDCGDPEQVANGQHALTSTVYDSRVGYSCDSGYELVGNASVRCLLNGQWSSPVPQCVPITCADPGKPMFGSRELEGLVYQNRVDWACNEGYNLVGSLSAICQADRTWTSHVPRCERIICVDPGRPTNGRYTHNGFEFGKTVRYTCNRGYEMPQGTLTVTCIGTGQWSQAKPTCLRISCPQLDSLANGKSRRTGVRYQDTVTYECSTGYFMVGHPTGTLTATCMETKAWSQPKPECQRIFCVDPGRPTNGQYVRNGVEYGKTIRYTCNTGYKMENIPSGTLTVTCIGTGQWSQAKPTCQRIICEDPGQPTNGGYTHNGFEFGKTVRYTCKTGYEMPQGTLTVTCIGTGQWSQAKPTCQPRQCPTPGKPDSGQYRVARQGQYVSRPFQYGDTVLWFCNKGFTGSTRAVCQADGRWSKNTPTCTRISCQDQGRLVNGDSTSTGQQFGSTVTYRCHKGFYMEGSTSGVVTTRCLFDTRWSHDKPTCLPRACPDPGSPTFGAFSVQMGVQRASLTPYLYNDTVTWTCYIGYSTTQPTTAVCQANERWSNNRPGCQRIICRNPGRPENGKATTNGFDYGKNRRYTCNTGYKMENIPSGTLTVTCVGTGQWSQPKPTCQPRQCPTPVTPTSGQYYVERQGRRLWRRGPFQYDDIVRWVCDTGFTGNTNAVCQANSTWSKNTPTCIRISCPDPGAPTNGNYIVTGLKYEDTVTYTCRLGYDMLNHPNSSLTGVCMANKMWSSTQPECERNSSYCKSYSPIQNGNVNCSGRRIHDICQYQCDSGYVKERHSSIRCIPGTEVDGRWSERGSCSPRQCPTPGKPDSGQYRVARQGQYVSRPFQYGDTVLWFCNKGFTGSTRAVCQADGRWSKNTPTCTRISCQDQGRLVNGDSTSTGQQFGSTVTYRCHKGFYMEGSTSGVVTTRCLFDTRWSHDKPTCLPRACPDPGSPTFGAFSVQMGVQRASLTPYLYNDTVTWTCYIGYSTTQPTTAVCQANERWSNNRPGCQRIICRNPGRPENGKATTNGFDYGKNRRYTCNTGYKMENIPSGTLTVTCVGTGQWSQPKPTCQPRQCPTPVTPTSGQYYVERQGRRLWRRGPFQYDDIVRWVCDTGFTGNTNAVCQANSTWSKNTPTCIRISCPDPGAPTNGNYIVTGLKYEDTVTYTCRLGYDMLNHPNSSLTGVCMANKMWSSTQPECERNSSYCKSYSPIQNGNVNCSGRRIHDICQYQCDSGYVKERHSSIRCIPGTEVDGRWSERGSCSPINHYCEITQIHAPLYGRIEANSTQLNDMAYFQCVDGYDINVTAEPVKCIVLNQTHGQWSDYTTPECFLPASIAIPQQNVTATISTHVTLRCQVVGTNITLSWQRTESSEHSWDELGYQITNKSNIHHNMTDSQLEISSVRRADGGTYTCSAWNPISRAQKSITLIVQGLSCPDQGQLANGYSTLTGQHFGSAVTYQCHTGFYLLGSTSGVVTARCMSNRRWSHDKPACLPRTCPNPGSPTSGSSSVRMGIQRASLTHYLYNDTVTWTCDIGYSTTEPTTAVCQASGGWSNNHPDCKHISCQDQGQLANGDSTSTGQQFGSTVTYQCHTGFYLLGSTSGVVTARCMSNKRWSHDKPTCLPRACHNPGRPTFGDFSVQMGIQRAHLTPYLYNDTVTWTCDIGYATTQPTTAVCQANQTWSNNRPGCQSITTIRPPSTRQISPQFTKERNTRAESTPTTVQLPTTSSHLDESEEYSSGLGQSAIIGISASVGTVLVISAIFCSVWWTSRMYTKRSCSGVSSDKEHQCSNKAGEGDGIYETVIGERLDQTDVLMTVEQSKEAADPMYESPANMSTTKTSCVHTSNEAYATTSDML